MAYTVGSASVDIVPDFKNAQLAITAFFERQKNELRVPVKIDLDKQIDSGDLERQAANVGSRVSKAMSDGAAKNQVSADKLALQQARAQERSLLFAHGEALKIQAQMDREAAKATKALLDEETKARIQADRDAERSQRESLKAINQTHAEALRLNAQLDRDNARREAQQRRADETAVAQAMRTAQRIADAERKAATQSATERARQREIDFRLEEKVFQEQIRSQIRAMKAAQREASHEEKIRLQVEIDERQSLLAGRNAGGLVTRAMRQELHQNAGLITAALYGVLIAGAPLAIGAAFALFAGIGAVAAAQSERVRSTYIGLWADIKSGAQADAASLVPVFERTAGQIGQSFQRMRPLIRDAFVASGPLIESFTSSVLKAGENALPGLVRAVQTARPAISGLGDLVEKTGSGVGRFFDVISTHSFAAGQAASSLGDAVEALLPTLAELLGQGAETAAIVLPVIASGFRGLNTVIGLTGNLLPRVLAAFLAFRAVQGLGRTIQGWGISLQTASAQGGVFAGSMQRGGQALSALGRALPVAGVFFGLLAADAARSEQAIADWTQTLMKGGAEATRLRALIRDQQGQGDTFDLVGNSFGEALQEQFGKAEDGARRLYAAMTPLEKAQHDVDVATRALQKGMEDEGTSASELARLKADVARAAARQAAEEENLERATRGVTEAMVAQVDAARARVDASYGYQQALIDQQKALLDVTQAQTDLDEARADGDPAKIAEAELSLKEALLGVNDALSNRVKLAGEMAVSKLPAAMADDQKAILGAKASLEELNKIIAEGTVLDPDMEAYRQSLIDIVGAADGAMLRQAQLASALREVGVAVEEIPGTASVIITDNSPEVIAKLESLGFKTETLPDGTVKVTPATTEAQAALDNLATLLAGLDATTATATADLDPTPFNGSAAEVARQTKLLGDATPTPRANLDASQFAGVHTNTMNSIGLLNSQRPTPTANMNSNPFVTTYLDAMGRVQTLGAQRPTPVISAIDAASSTINYIRSALASIQDKTVSVTVRAVNVQNAKAAIEHAGGATGGSVGDILTGNTPRFALGGPTTGAVRYGSGGPWDDQVGIRVSPGEHVLDFGDVVAMGGQDAVYDFRRMLHDGYFNKAGQDNAIRQMVTTGAAPRRADTPVQSSSPSPVVLYTPDIPAAIRALKAHAHEEAALAPVW